MHTDQDDNEYFAVPKAVTIGWDVENGAPSEGSYVHPHGIISLTAPKLCVKEWTGPHFVGGRFVPKRLAEEHSLRLPKYPDAHQIVKLEDV
ncbi:unnamed protein product [Cylicostephanus goldi]|uniref:Uncharacterized protein n=1 Tax=Cylicostephanus goldi TaxID=71465 RepID=A0A3P7QDN8_CYLGO|nr:unnamed protein product [Cylicostephanus goldi]